MNSLPMYFPPAFDCTLALSCAYWTQHAYDMFDQWKAQGKPDEKGFRWNPTAASKGIVWSAPFWSRESLLGLLDESEPFGYAARTPDGDAFLVFRGTDSFADWISDADARQTRYEFAPDYGEVHHGFYHLYASMREQVAQRLQKLGEIQRLCVTGHSLGCGLSTLAVPDLRHARSDLSLKHYNLASPRVGAPSFTNAYNGNGVPTYRVVNTCDLVPQVPTAVLGDDLFQHVGTPVCFTAQYGSLGSNHSLMDAYAYALDHPQTPAHPSGESGAVLAR